MSCASCCTPYHAECWQYNKGCSVYGCGEQQSKEFEELPTASLQTISEDNIPMAPTRPDSTAKIVLKTLLASGLVAAFIVFQVSITFIFVTPALFVYMLSRVFRGVITRKPLLSAFIFLGWAYTCWLSIGLLDSYNLTYVTMTWLNVFIYGGLTCASLGAAALAGWVEPTFKRRLPSYPRLASLVFVNIGTFFPIIFLFFHVWTALRINILALAAFIPVSVMATYHLEPDEPPTKTKGSKTPTTTLVNEDDIVYALWPTMSLMVLLTYFNTGFLSQYSSWETVTVTLLAVALLIAYKTTVELRKPGFGRWFFALTTCALAITVRAILLGYNWYFPLAFIEELAAGLGIIITASAILGSNWFVLWAKDRRLPAISTVANIRFGKAILVALATYLTVTGAWALTADHIFNKDLIAGFIFISLYPMLAVMEEVRLNRLPKLHKQLKEQSKKG